MSVVTATCVINLSSSRRQTKGSVALRFHLRQSLEMAKSRRARVSRRWSQRSSVDDALSTLPRVEGELHQVVSVENNPQRVRAMALVQNITTAATVTFMPSLLFLVDSGYESFGAIRIAAVRITQRE